MTLPPAYLKVDQDSPFQVKVWMAVFTLVQMSPMVCFNLTKPAQCKSIGLLACQSLCVFLRFKCYQEVGFLVDVLNSSKLRSLLPSVSFQAHHMSISSGSTSAQMSGLQTHSPS